MELPGKNVERDLIERSIATLTGHVHATRDSAFRLISYDCDEAYWKGKDTIAYVISGCAAMENIIRYLYCWLGTPTPPEISTVRAFIDARKQEALAISLTRSSSWHLYDIEEYLFSLAALELALDGQLNPKPLEKLWTALEIHHKKERRDVGWKSLFDSEAPTLNMISGLVGKILMGDGNSVIEFMKYCPEVRKMDVEAHDFERQPYKVAYHTALRQMKQVDPHSAYYGQRTHAAFFTWAWLNAWKDNILPGTFTFTGMFMLWAAIRKSEGLPLEPGAILQSFQPEPVCRLFLDCLGQALLHNECPHK